MQTKDVRDLKRRFVHRPLPLRPLRLRFGVRDFTDFLDRLGQQVKRARGGTNGIARDVGVPGRSPQAAMTEQNLDHSDISSRPAYRK